MKAPSEWKEEDVQRMIDDKTEENLSLEYKGCRAFNKADDKKKEAIGIAVSAFANSQGGVILYGVREDANNHLPETIEGIDPVDFKKEWLEEIINARISRRIEGVKIYPITLSGVNLGKVLYAVDVPESPLAPHQASDRRYYKRYNFQCLPMEDYEVRDVANRRRNPIVKAQFERVSSFHPASTLPGDPNVEGPMSLIIRNEGQMLAEKIYLELSMPRKTVGRIRAFASQESENLVMNGAEYIVYKYIHRDAGGLLPLFPGASIERSHGLALNGAWFQENFGLPIKCKVFADHSEPREFTVTLQDLVPQEYKDRYPVRQK